MTPPDLVRAWRPAVPGIAEVLHADWRAHAYPMHAHDTWTLLIVDDGRIGYRLAGHDRRATPDDVTLLPPFLAHDGHAESARGFRKRVIYLDAGALGEELIGAAADGPTLRDPRLHTTVAALDTALVRRDDFAAGEHLALAVERLRWHLRGRVAPTVSVPSATVVAAAARERLDADVTADVTVAGIAAALGVSAPHLIRSFTAVYGLAPHQYLLSRRLGLARQRLLDGERAADVATGTGFYDQAHLTRHFRRLLPTTPARYRAEAPHLRSWVNPVQAGGG